MTEARGKDLLDLSPETLFQEHGIHIIHRSLFGKYLKNGKPNLPKRLKGCWESWLLHHPFALCVTWTDADNRELVSRFYPHHLDTYDSMKLPIQQCDFSRLIFLHRYGGVYTDADYEAHTNIFPHLPNAADVMIVESPVFVNEAVQNSLMVTPRPGVPFWEHCIDNIAEGVRFLNDPKACDLPSSRCELTKLFRNPLTSKISNLLWTGFMTGPGAIDKTIVREVSKDNTLKFTPLSKEKWESGPIATHHHNAGWFSIPQAIPELITIGVIGLAVILFLFILMTIVISSRRCRSWCAQVCDGSVVEP